MKTLIVILLLGGAGFLGYKYLYKGSSQTSADDTAKFMASCRQASASVDKVEAYCQCLADRGVKSMMSLATRPASREALTACQNKVGHVAQPADQPGRGADDSPASSEGRAVEGMKRQLQEAYKRRAP